MGAGVKIVTGILHGVVVQVLEGVSSMSLLGGVGLGFSGLEDKVNNQSVAYY